MIKKGYIGFSNNKIGLLPKIIRFFTNSKISHTFLITQSIENEISVQEAAFLVQIVPFSKYYKEDDTQSYWIYKIENITEEEISKALEMCFKEFAGIKYGKFQLLWFVWRWINEKFGRDVRHERNWFTDGLICSELVYYFLKYLGFGYLLKDFNPDTIQAQDILNIFENNPKQFTLIKIKL